MVATCLSTLTPNRNRGATSAEPRGPVAWWVGRVHPPPQTQNSATQPVERAAGGAAQQQQRDDHAV